ncbi:MAG: CD225/dispanin family protein [Rikenellaceae bacterium]
MENQQFQQNAPIRPKTWLVESILVTLFCCLPFGIVGIINAAKVDELFDRGDYELAQIKSNEAGKWTKIGFFIGLGVVVLYFILVLIGVAAGIGGAYYGY